MALTEKNNERGQNSATISRIIDKLISISINNKYIALLGKFQGDIDGVDEESVKQVILYAN